ncbi:hypothetical protein ACFWWX_30660, partial [Streptomyces niveus]
MTQPGTSGPVPLTSAQRGIWLGDRLAGPGRYHVGLSMDIKGPLDPDLFEAAFGAVVAETAPLRARVPGDAPRPAPPAAPPDVITGLKTIADRVHAAGLKIVG